MLRQSAVFHRLNATSRQNLFVFFSPNARSAVDLAAQVALQNDPADVLGDGAFWLHERLFSAHAPSWRRYIASLELEVLPIVRLSTGRSAAQLLTPLSGRHDSRVLHRGPPERRVRPPEQAGGHGAAALPHDDAA